jgi:hypothetical protein
MNLSMVGAQIKSSARGRSRCLQPVVVVVRQGGVDADFRSGREKDATSHHAKLCDGRIKHILTTVEQSEPERAAVALCGTCAWVGCTCT